MNYSAVREELAKIAKDLTESARAHIKAKNFAVPAQESPTGKPAYPIHDEAHARAALGLVGMHGTSTEKQEVRAAVAKKYPELLSKKQAGVLRSAGDILAGRGALGEHGNELLGLGLIAAPVADDIQAHLRGGHDEKEQARKKLLPALAGHAMDLGGLGVLAAPAARKLMTGEH